MCVCVCVSRFVREINFLSWRVLQTIVCNTRQLKKLKNL